MSTRSRRRAAQDERIDDAFEDDFSFQNASLEDITDEDVELFMELQEDEQKEPGFWNLPTIAGLSIIAVGGGYLLQEIGLVFPFQLEGLVAILPWLAGILIILLGFGVLNWKPGKSRKAKKLEKRLRRKAAKARSRARTADDRVRAARSEASADKIRARARRPRKMTKTRDKKMAGVAGGLAEYFGVDPTLVRIAFVIATLFSFPTPIIVYVILSAFMNNPEPRPALPKEKRITIRRG
ncbi:MAG: PspC domain-containing protein [Bacteroidota bacterium]